jgi:hypothetical protein
MHALRGWASRSPYQPRHERRGVTAVLPLQRRTAAPPGAPMGHEFRKGDAVWMSSPRSGCCGLVV